jgi:hypothetical protein
MIRSMHNIYVVMGITIWGHPLKIKHLSTNMREAKWFYKDLAKQGKHDYLQLCRYFNKSDDDHEILESCNNKWSGERPLEGTLNVYW